VFLSCTSSIANAIGLSIVPLLLASFYSAKEVGWYALVSRLALAPLGLITNAVMQSFWAEAARLVKIDKKKLRDMYLGATLKLGLLSLPVIVLCVAAPLYTAFIFGAEWDGAGYVLAALTPMIVGQVMVAPLTHLIVHEKQKWQLAWDVVRTVIVAGIIVLGPVYNLSMMYVVFMTSAFSFVMYAVLFAINLYYLSTPDVTYAENHSEDMIMD
jgi:O-antigen/teichoic acid export membrane protein